jgi:antitoxin (DNA-binding transcriptional repressor) of toxin-antitoxin stability system
MMPMATFRISEADAARDFAALMKRVRAGEEIEIKSGSNTVAVIKPPAPSRRTVEEILACLPEDSPAVIDEDFATDVAAAVAAHRDPLNPPAWD